MSKTTSRTTLFYASNRLFRVLKTVLVIANSDSNNFDTNFNKFDTNFQNDFFVPILLLIDFWTQKNDFGAKNFKFRKKKFSSFIRAKPFAKSKIFFFEIENFLRQSRF